MAAGLDPAMIGVGGHQDLQWPGRVGEEGGDGLEHGRGRVALSANR
jgi:hypothetical protein